MCLWKLLTYKVPKMEIIQIYKQMTHTNFFAQFQSAMFSQYRLQLSPLAKSAGRGRRDAQINFL